MHDPSVLSGGRRATAGVLLALGAAATFGVFTPAAKGALAQVGPIRGAGLAYLAAGTIALGVLLTRALAGMLPIGRRPARHDAPRLLGMSVFGGVVGPALFFAGVSRVAAHHAAVMQHLEFVLTVLAAVLVLGERPGRRGVAGLLFVGAGIALLSVAGVDAGGAGGSSWTGMALIVAACAAWAADNTLARGASDLDPLVVVSIKGLGAGSAWTLASAASPWLLDVRGWGLLLLAGGVGVGVSLLLELLALRRIGAALNAGLFATGPAFGFLWSLAFLGERGGAWSWAALALCGLGAVLLAVDRHAHAHVHHPIRHVHRHHHLDGHHDHAHDPGFDPATEHVHEHEHETVRHAHRHVHDEHHRHRH
jgi:drug/metabolite transporter (DMT)-like permease